MSELKIKGESIPRHQLGDISYSKKLMITTTDEERKLIKQVLEVAR